MAVASPTKVGPKFQVTIPLPVRQATGLKAGDLIEAQAEQDGTIRLKRKRLVDYDPEVEADIAASEADLKAGRVLGPFETTAQVRRALKDYKAKMAEGRRGKKGNAPGAVKRRTHARTAH